MSLPKFPDNNSSITREDVINQIISSVAMEELGLSHIINAEGEKLQYALGTLEGVTGPTESATIKDLLELNQSVRETLDSTMTNQMFLKGKLKDALSTSTMQGEPGAPGMQIKGSYETLQELQKANPIGNAGDAYLVGNGDLYAWNTETGAWELIGNLSGPDGSLAPGQPLFTVEGQNDSKEEIPFEGTLDIESDTLDVTVEPGPKINLESQAGAIVPFASGTSEVISTLPGGGRSQVIMVGFGTHSMMIIPNNPIVLGSTSGAIHLAFPMPEDGIIKALSAYVNVAGAPTSDSAVVAELFASSTPNNSFMPVADARIEMPITALAAPGTALFGTKELSTKVTKNTRLLLVFYSLSNTAVSITMHVSGSVKIVPAVKTQTP